MAAEEGSRRWAGLVFAVSARRVSRGVFDPFVGDVMCIGRSATAALDVPRGAIDVRRSHVLRGITRTVAGRLRASSPAILIGRSPTTALDAPWGPSMFVDRTCGAARRRGAASLGPSIDRNTASQQAAGHRCARHLIRSSATRRAGRLRASSLAIIIGRSPTTALDVPRGPLTCFAGIGCAASVGPSIDRSTASQQPGARRCSRRWFVRGARGTSSSCRSFRRRCAVPDRTSTTITAVTWSRPTWGA